MNRFCGNCFNESLNEQGICTICGFNDHSNWDKAPYGLPAGTILNGRYIIGRVLGQGGFGITYTARDHQSGQLVAVKEFFPDTMATRTQRTTVTPFSGERGEGFGYGKECFLREAQTMAEFIGNSTIVRVYSYFEENETAYFVMEYVDGMSLQEYLKSKGGAISLEEALKILYPVMDALSAVHEKGIIHRDIAPDNIYISKDGTVKLLDFGAARYSLGNVSRSLDVILKHGFAPREQYKRRGRQGPYTDVYSTAATLYYAITGNRPDDALERQDEDDMPLPSSLGAKITPQQEDVLLKAMEIDCEKRYQTMAEFRDAMMRATPVKVEIKQPPVEKPKAPETAEPAPVQKQETKKKVKWLVPAAAAVALCAVGAVLALGGKPDVSLSATPTEAMQQMDSEVTPDPDVVPVAVSLTAEEIAYNEAVDLFKNGEYGKAAIAFGKLGDFRDAREISRQIWDAIADRDTICAGHGSTLAVREDGTVASCGQYVFEDVDTLENVVAIAGYGYWGSLVALNSDGTVVCAVKELGWTDIVDVDVAVMYSYDAYYYRSLYVLGLKSDGTVAVATFDEPTSEQLAYQKQFENLQDVVKIHGSGRIIELADGTILKDFEKAEDQDLIDSADLRFGLAMLKQDGTVEFEITEGSLTDEQKNTADNIAYKMKEDTAQWEDIVAVAGSGEVELFGIKSDGTVVATGDNSGARPLDVYKWENVVSVAASDCHGVGLTSDGTLVTSGNSALGERQTWGMNDLRLPADRDALLAEIHLEYIT